MRQALELALKALEEFGEHYNWCHQFPTYASPEEYPPCNCGYDKAITAIKEALAQPEQEPVAWTEKVGGIGFKEPMPNANYKVTATIAPQRKPLTDDEIAEFAERMEASDPTDSFWREFARAIEAAHGIKE